MPRVSGDDISTSFQRPAADSGDDLHVREIMMFHAFRRSRTARYCVVTSFLLVFLLLGMAIPSAALEKIDTKYFTILYETDGEFTAGEIAKFCDDVYEKLMARYDAYDDNPRVVCLVNDAADLANGYAIHYQNTITIYATTMDYELRGQTNWLKNVFVHEMTHMVALKKAAKGPVNFYNVGGGRYDENPDLDVDVVLYHLSQPSWFSEGTAQLGAETIGPERWDTHRDMLLRSAWYEERLLSYDEMSVLTGMDGMEGEMVYNQGYALVRYIRDTYGYDKVVELNNRCGFFDFEPTIRSVLGIPPKKLYDDWRKTLDTKYAPFRQRENEPGEPVQDEGSMDFYPAVSPDGRYIAWLSNRGRDYAITDLMVTERVTGRTEKVVDDVDYRPSWSHDSSRLVYVKRPPKYPNFYDMYIYDVANREEKRISRQMRARDPYFSPGDSLIVFVRNEGGNNSLAIVRDDGTGLRYLTSTHDGTQFYSPSFSPDGTRIIFSIFRQHLDRDIASMDADAPSYRYQWEYADSTSGFSDSTSFAGSSGFRVIVGSDSDERDPVFLPDGGILYSSDRTGVFNIYRLDPVTGRSTRLTDVYGGAFCPSAAGDGTVYYGGFTSRDFSIYTTDLSSRIDTHEPAVEERDYIAQPEPFDPSEQFPVRPFMRKKIVNAIVPTMNIGPSFIGSSFGLNVVDVGADVYLTDLLGRDAMILRGNVGKNLKEDVSLNDEVDVYYQRRLSPITSSTYQHSPTIYVRGNRRVINNHIGRFNGEADSVYFADRPDEGYTNVLHALHQELSIADKYRHEFRRYMAGMHLPLAPRHTLRFEAGFRQYYETLKRHQVVSDYSTFIAGEDDITSEVPGARATYVDDTRYFTNMEYFRSGELAIAYSYSRMRPAADSDIAPRGTGVLFQFKHLRTTVADSLYGQVSYFVPVGLNQDLSFGLGQYQPDPMLDEFRPFKQNIDVNEYTLYAQRNQKLPYWRHVLGGIAFIGYRDIYLKDYRKGEGNGYNWPLKYYLGGAGLLSGYPYFSFWGSKIAYGKLDYTFPLAYRMARTVMGMHFQRLYGNVFFEAGHAWNFEKLSLDRLKQGSFKRDVGVEIRLKTVWFYRLPAMLSVKVAWPLDDMKDSPYSDERDARRYYFSLRM